MKKKLIIIIAIVLILGGVGGFIGWKFLAGDKVDSTGETDETSQEKTGDEKDTDSALMVFPLDPFVVNLSGSGGRRYLKMKMTLEIDGSKAEKLKNENHKIRDALIILLSSKTLEDIMGAEGKYSLREEIKVRLERILGKDIVENVYIVDFVVQ